MVAVEFDSLHRARQQTGAQGRHFAGDRIARSNHLLGGVARHPRKSFRRFQPQHAVCVDFPVSRAGKKRAGRPPQARFGALARGVPGQGGGAVRFRYAIIPVEARNLLDHVRLPLDVGAEGGRDAAKPGGFRFAFLRYVETDASQQALADVQRNAYAQHIRYPRCAHGNRRGRRGRGVGVHHAGDHRAAAELRHERGGPRGGARLPGGVHAALEAIAGVALDAKRLRRSANMRRVEEGGLHQHVSRGFPDLRILPAHHAADGYVPFGVRNHDGAGRDYALLVVERGERGGRLGEPYANALSAEGVEIKRMQRLAHVVEHVIRDVHDVVAGP